ncbi:hypothetical protein [Leucobacter sp. GX24907]
MEINRTWPEWFRWHLDQAPFQLLHMRELAEHTLRAQDTTRDVVTGSSEQDRLPYNTQAADDADALYAELVLFAREVAEHTGYPSPRPVRAGHWQGRHEPQGLPSCRPDEAFGWSTEIRNWLTNLIHDLELMAADGALGDAPTHLVQTIRKMRARYPRSEPQFKAYRPRSCPICQQPTILPVWGTEGLEAMQCDTCKKVFPSSRYSTTATPTPTEKPPPESDEHHSPSSTGDAADSA